MRVKHDQTFCTGCQACVIACLEKHQSPIEDKRCHIAFVENQGHLIGKYRFKTCMQCSQPKCLEACPNGALIKNERGIILYDEAKCNLCLDCISACPFESAICLSKTLGRIVKCDLCMSLDGQAACIGACPYDCLSLT